jgi:hypothetical protein
VLAATQRDERAVAPPDRSALMPVGPPGPAEDAAQLGLDRVDRRRDVERV